MAVDNRKGALAAKVWLRQRLLERMRPCRVLDCYAGIDGEMYAGAWSKADSYLGIDRRIRIQADKRPRILGDTLDVLEQLDLEPFTVFDIDAYGSPWDALVAIGQRRTFRAPFGLGLTDGTHMLLKFGAMSETMAELLGRRSNKFVYQGGEHSREIHRRCLARWCAINGLRVVEGWWYVDRAGGAVNGTLAMTYSTSIIAPL